MEVCEVLRNLLCRKENDTAAASDGAECRRGVR